MKKPLSANIKNLCASAMLLAAALLLPLLTGQIPQLGSALCPMHIPVLLCGFVCGWQWGLAVGATAPLLRFAIFGMPPIFPTGVAMAFELAAYGAMTGLLCKLLPKKNVFVYLNLIISMIAGRLVWGAVMYAIAGLGGSEFSVTAFWTGAVVNAIPGIVLQIVLVPVAVIVLRKANLTLDRKAERQKALKG